MVRKNDQQKIKMEKIKNEAKLRAAFSRGKSDVFKKASELCTSCDAKVALIIFSPSGNTFSFGQPNVYSLFDRLSSRSRNCIRRRSPNIEHVESNTNSHLQDLNKILTQVLAESEKESKKKSRYKIIIKNERLNNNSENWFQKPVEELNLPEAIHLKSVAEELKKKIDDFHSQFKQRIITSPNYHVGSSSNVAPGTINGDTYYTSHSWMSTNAFNDDPNMITSNQSLPFEYNHGDNNISERFVPDCAVNCTPWYNHSQIQSQEPEQGHCEDRPRYY